MTQATINLANDGFGRSAAGLVYGGLFVQLGDLQFPDPRWTDSVVVILGWWCRALSRLLAGEREPIEVRFMEGPYLVKVGPSSGQSMHLELVEAGLTLRVRGQAEVATDVLVDSVLSAAARTLTECKASGWWSDDANELADAMKVLRHESERTENREIDRR